MSSELDKHIERLDPKTGTAAAFRELREELRTFRQHMETFGERLIALEVRQDATTDVD